MRINSVLKLILTESSQEPPFVRVLQSRQDQLNAFKAETDHVFS